MPDSDQITELFQRFRIDTRSSVERKHCDVMTSLSKVLRDVENPHLPAVQQGKGNLWRKLQNIQCVRVQRSPAISGRQLSEAGAQAS